MYDSRDRVMGTEGTENYVVVSSRDIGRITNRSECHDSTE